MKNGWIFVSILTTFVVVVNGRVYYLPTLDENRYDDLTYPIPNEQSSRDLDLSFFAGDSSEPDSKIHPVKKRIKADYVVSFVTQLHNAFENTQSRTKRSGQVYTLVAPEKPVMEVNKEELPITRYKLVEAPVKRVGSDDIIMVPEVNRKMVKIDRNSKGEVILELRVIANHDTV